MTARSAPDLFGALAAGIERAELEAHSRRTLISPLAQARRYALGRAISLPAPPPLVRSCVQVEPECGLAHLGRSCQELALGLSRHLGGQFWWGSTGVVWNKGGQLFWLLDWEQWEQVQAAKAVLNSLLVPCRSWTLGGMARALLKWLNLSQRHLRCTEHSLGGVGPGYACVVPGEYSFATLYDLDAAYYQILSRLPSPRVTWIKGKPLWHPLSPDEAERWEQVKAACQTSKGLRNALVGAMQGGGRASACYVKGEAVPGRTPQGPLVSAARTIQRTCYELCALQAAAGAARYARTDCVILLDDKAPLVWASYGYGFSARAAGTAAVVGLDVYRVGDRQTKWFGCRSLAVPDAYYQSQPPSLTLAAWH